MGNLRLVCREWGYIVDELIQKDGEQKTPYAYLSPISQHFVKAAFGGLGNDAFYEVFAKLRLIYRPTPESEGVVLPFLGLKNPFCGTFNLAECGDTGQDLRFTTSLKDFFEIGGENKDRVVILFAPRSLVTQRKESTAKPLSPVMELWTSDLGIFWRWGSSEDLCWFYHMVTRPLVGSDGIASENLLKHWEKSKEKDVVDDGPPGVESLAYFTLDCEPKLEL